MRLLKIALCLFLLVSCSKPAEQTSLANPASVHCAETGGKVDIRTNADGSQTGYCVFENGKECEEWAFYRKECSR